MKLGANGSGPYINASFVESASGETGGAPTMHCAVVELFLAWTGEFPDWSFIAAQGPMKDTVDDFWQMVYEYQCRAIVMLTRFIEGNSEKCAVYFPRHVGHVIRTRHLQVKLMEREDVTMDITVRRFRLEHETSREVIEVRLSVYPAEVGSGMCVFRFRIITIMNGRIMASPNSRVQQEIS